MKVSKFVTLSIFALFSISATASNNVESESIQLQSGSEKTHLLQVYTSEGCSSCPPADKWLSSQIDNPDLFKTFIPMSFHVDYWDYIGWDDPFADSAFSKRQRLLKAQNIIDSVYTPGIVFAGKEFRQWFRGDRDLSIKPEKAKVLNVDIEAQSIMVNYDSDLEDLKVNVALLKMNQFSDVKSGENHGKKFVHDFVVAEFVQFDYKKSIKKKFEFLSDKEDSALVVWITKDDRLENLQAVAGYL